MRVLIKDVRKVCMDYPGMWDDFWRAGKRDGDCIELSRGAFNEINNKYLHGPKLGTALHLVLQPVAKIIDAAVGTRLQECGECGGRELKANAATAAVTAES